jgi:hypothetical protein
VADWSIEVKVRDASLRGLLTDTGVPYNNLIIKFFGPKVGRCRFSVSKPELKACLVSALETKS